MSGPVAGRVRKLEVELAPGERPESAWCYFGGQNKSGWQWQFAHGSKGKIFHLFAGSDCLPEWLPPDSPCHLYGLCRGQPYPREGHGRAPVLDAEVVEQVLDRLLDCLPPEAAAIVARAEIVIICSNPPLGPPLPPLSPRDEP
jgi:hypothetical protein